MNLNSTKEREKESEMKTSYQFYEDPEHGWLKVTRQELKELNIERDISPYSYQRNNVVFLEEDCDMDTFCKAKALQGCNFTKLKITRNVSNKSSKIRHYDCYDSDRFN